MVRSISDQVELLQALEVTDDESFLPGDRMVKGCIIKTRGKTIVRDSSDLANEHDAHEPFIVWECAGGPILVCGDDTLYRLSKLECLMVRARVMSVNYLDGRYNSHDRQGG